MALTRELHLTGVKDAYRLCLGVAEQARYRQMVSCGTGITTHAIGAFDPWARLLAPEVVPGFYEDRLVEAELGSVGGLNLGYMHFAISQGELLRSAGRRVGSD